MSEIREAVARLLAQELSLNEIAHRLDVARSTVGYHAAALREQRQDGQRKGRRAVNGGPPVAARDVTRERVRHLLELGNTRAHVAETLGIARSTVTFHAARLGYDIDERCARRYDWEAVRRFYEEGHSAAQCRSTFGFTRRAWYEAVRREAITPRPARIPLQELLVAGPRRNRNHLKRRLFDAGVKSRSCESCGLTEWRGNPVPLTLHHVNGDRHDNRLENLQILCANCHSLTDTWAGRNIPRLRGRAAPGANHSTSGDAQIRAGCPSGAK